MNPSLILKTVRNDVPPVTKFDTRTSYSAQKQSLDDCAGNWQGYESLQNSSEVLDSVQDLTQKIRPELIQPVE